MISFTLRLDVFLPTGEMFQHLCGFDLWCLVLPVWTIMVAVCDDMAH